MAANGGPVESYDEVVAGFDTQDLRALSLTFANSGDERALLLALIAISRSLDGIKEAIQDQRKR